MVIHPESHVDHGLTPEHIAHIMERFSDRSEFFIETFDLPDTLPDAPCGLYGPAMGDKPIRDGEAMMVQRKGRHGVSRMVPYPTRPTRTLTVIAGPHEADACVLYTAHGGPASPREPNDIDPVREPEAIAESRAFWAQHALALQ